MRTIVSGIVVLLLGGCASAQPGPWVYQDGAWCRAGSLGCTTVAKSEPWWKLGMTDDQWRILNDTVVNAPR